MLGIPANADFKQVQRAYNNKRRDAQGDEAALARVEAAYNAFFMGSLTSRVAGGTTKDVRFADRPKYFPWRPRCVRVGQESVCVGACGRAVENQESVGG